MTTLPWIGIVLCLSQSAMFSGLNLALFGLSRLELEIAAEQGDEQAKRILGLRRDANFLLTTVLWGNVGVNCLLTLLTDSVMTGVAAFAVSTGAITFFGEVLPQASFSRNAMRVGSLFAPWLRAWQFILYPVARPTAKVLDWLVGPEGVTYMRERDLRAVIERHMHAEEADLNHREGVGALNFLTLDDLAVGDEGEAVDASSVIALPTKVDLPVIPPHTSSPDDPWLHVVGSSGHKWVILTDESAERPHLVLDSDAFLRAALSSASGVDAYRFCHRPIVATDRRTKIGGLLRRLSVDPESAEDDVIDNDLILLWTAKEKRIITGADLLGRILRGIVRRDEGLAAARA